VGAPWLAHKASHEGVICVEKIAGLDHVQPLDVLNVPGCTYCTPQVASVGLTEAKAKAGGREVIPLKHRPLAVGAVASTSRLPC
jgi:dihydrolipoamide dehydrogenase